MLFNFEALNFYLLECANIFLFVMTKILFQFKVFFSEDNEFPKILTSSMNKIILFSIKSIY